MSNSADQTLSASRPGYEHRIVPISGLQICDNSKVILCSHSIGMGLVVSAYDPVSRVGGLFHAMLPEAQASPARAKDKPGMFVDTGWEALIHGLKLAGAAPARLHFYAVGGAEVMGTSSKLNMGLRNAEALQLLLTTRRVQPTGVQLGGYTCRSFYLAIESGATSVALFGQFNETSLCHP